MDSKKIAKRLIEIRGKTPRQEVCDACDISLSALTMYELGERIPRDEIKIRIADFYGVSVQDLFFA